jgi:hypothetical protein
MKKILFTFSILFSTIAFSQTATYPGNGNNSFGGAIGKGSIAITEAGDTVIFKLNRGTSTFDSLLVFYIDEPTTATGVSSTANLSFTGTPDKYSVAVSGRFSPTQQAVLNFPASFKPDMAIVFDKDGGKLYFLYEVFGVAMMQEQGIFMVYPAGNNSAPTYTAITNKTQYGLAPTDSLNFNFMGTYIGQTASRSNEGFGDPFTGYQRTSSYNPYTVQSYLHFSSSQALPVSLVDFKASAEQGRVKINWTVAQEINIDEYQVQRSATGRDFATIATLKATNAAGSTTYNSFDASPLKGNNYYRLIIKEKGGSQVSKVIVIKNGSVKNNFAVIQAGNVLNVQLQGVPAGDYRLVVVNSNGQLIHSANINHDGADGTRQLDLKATPAKGIYRVVLQSADVKLTESIFIQ